MIYKLLITGIGLAVTYLIARKMSENNEKSRVKVRRDEQELTGQRLRQDPETGVYYPED